MFRYIIQRIIYSIPIALGVTVIVFSLVYLGPGDPLDAVLPDDATAADVQEIKELYGFDKPLPVQYAIWLGRAVTGDLGTSIGTGQPVTDGLKRAVVNTLILAFFASIFGFTIASVLGIVAGYHHGRWADKVVSTLAITGVSVPNYWLAIVLIIIFSVELNWLPSLGMGPGESAAWTLDWAHMRHMILPMIGVSIISMGIIARSMRAAVAEILNQEFVQTLRSKGLMERQVLRHVVKNAAPTVMAVTGLQIGKLMGGSILIETIFAWPGTGFLLNEAIFRRDLPVLQGTILVLAMFFVTVNLIVDVMQTSVDPRIRRD